MLGISTACTKPEAAWNAIRYLTSPEVSGPAVTDLRTVNDPFRRSHLVASGAGPFPDEATHRRFLEVLQEGLRHTTADLTIPGGWEYMQILDRHIGLALIGKVRPAEALQHAAGEWERLTDRYGRARQEAAYRSWTGRLAKAVGP